MSVVRFYCVCLLVSLRLRSVHCVSYRFVVEDEDMFDKCPDNPYGIENLYDLSNFTTVRDEDSVRIEGDLKIIWDVQETDRIELEIFTYHLERGDYQPTIFNLISKDLCKNFYKKGELWYKFWTKHIINKDDAKNCFNHNGAILKHEPFNLEIEVSNLYTATLSGSYKLVFIMRAFDKKNVQRKPEICFEMRGESVRIK